MRWKQKQKQKFCPVIGTKRIIKKFLIMPRTIDLETRWLETALVEQEYARFSIYSRFNNNKHFWGTNTGSDIQWA